MPDNWIMRPIIEFIRDQTELFDLIEIGADTLVRRAGRRLREKHSKTSLNKFWFKVQNFLFPGVSESCVANVSCPKTHPEKMPQKSKMSEGFGVVAKI